MTTIKKAEQFVFELLKDRLPTSYRYHNFNHTIRVVEAVRKILKTEKLDENEQTALFLAAWFHDTGYVNAYEDHEEKSILILNGFSESNEVNAEIVTIASKLIRATRIDTNPQDLLENVICDADTSHFSDKDYLNISEQLREEWKLTQAKNYTDLEWLEGNLAMLNRSHRYYTDHAKKKWQKGKEKNIRLIEEKIRLLSGYIVPNEAEKKKKDKNGDKPERGIETMFRVTLNNHTQLSQIADSKANILLSVNAIIISIALSSLIPKLDSPGNAHLIVPTFIMLFFSVLSIVFAIFATKPKVTGGSFTRKQIEEKKVNLLFFGNFYKMPMEEYLWAMKEMMKDKEYLYDSMVKDLYFLGIVLNRKYKLLRITYTVFMVGIIISVVAFVLAFNRFNLFLG